MKIRIAAILAGLVAWTPVNVDADTYVRDGDTIVVSGTPVRLKGLDCPETKTRAGRRARTAMRSLLGRAREVECRLTGERTYDREVGFCAADGRDLGEAMVAGGWCGSCPRYSRRYVHLDRYSGPRAPYCRR